MAVVNESLEPLIKLIRVHTHDEDAGGIHGENLNQVLWSAGGPGGYKLGGKLFDVSEPILGSRPEPDTAAAPQ